MDNGQDFFWMGGRLARGLEEVSSDPRVLEDGNFWAISTTFEGEGCFARFSEVTESDFPQSSDTWMALSDQWISSMDEPSFLTYVESIRESVLRGDVYQVNACREISIGGVTQSLAPLFSKLLADNPAPFATYLKIPELEIASASPERFLSRNGSTILTSPIKGTQTLNMDGFGEKDQSENIMIVDLMRNDLGKICLPGSVEVSALLRSEDHPGLRHLVSDVVGELSSDISWRHILESLSPPGSVSGTPKSSALKIISQSEPAARGNYCGVLGWIEGDKAQLAVAIRTFWRRQDQVLRFGTGAGITWGSNPHDEWEETQLKARKLLSIAGGEIA